MSRYRKVQVRMWGDEKFVALSPMPACGQGLWIYLLTGPHTSPIPGLFRAGRASMAEELNWPQEAFDKAFAEVLSKGLAKADFKARLVWLPNAVEHNRPESPNVVRSWGAEFDALPECALKIEAFNALKSFIYGLGESFKKAFEETFLKPLPKPYGKAMPNQEQEQEQKQEQKEKRMAPAGAARTEGMIETAFEVAWKQYPKRLGGNSRTDAFKAFKARCVAGVSPSVMIAGTARYAAFIKAKGDEGTEFVKQASTFYGPGGHYADPWDFSPPAKAKTIRAGDIQAVSDHNDTVLAEFRRQQASEQQHTAEHPELTT